MPVDPAPPGLSRLEGVCTPGARETPRPFRVVCPPQELEPDGVAKPSLKGVGEARFTPPAKDGLILLHTASDGGGWEFLCCQEGIQFHVGHLKGSCASPAEMKGFERTLKNLSVASRGAARTLADAPIKPTPGLILLFIYAFI